MEAYPCPGYARAAEATLAAEQSARMVYMMRSMNAAFKPLPPEVVSGLHSTYQKKYHPTKA